jgi:hypothetical protein
VPLGNTAVSATFTSANGVGFVAERAMWWPGSSATWREAHVSLGAEQTCPRWAIAEGEWADGVDTYVLVPNTGTSPTTLRTTLLREGMTPLAADVPIAAGSRQNVDVHGLFPQAFGTRFGMLVEVAPTAPVAPLVVEWAHYADAAGVHWSAGAAALGTCVP